MTRPLRLPDDVIVHRDADGVARVAPDWESLTERLIREAQEAGQFDDLPGRGRPLTLHDDTFAGDMAIAHHVLHNAGVSPPWIEADKEARQARALIEALLQRARHCPASHAGRLSRELEALADGHDAAARRLEGMAPTPRQQRRPTDRAALRARLSEALAAKPQAS